MLRVSQDLATGGTAAFGGTLNGCCRGQEAGIAHGPTAGSKLQLQGISSFISTRGGIEDFPKPGFDMWHRRSSKTHISKRTEFRRSIRLATVFYKSISKTISTTVQRELRD
jgi:hypothetical protein